MHTLCCQVMIQLDKDNLMQPSCYKSSLREGDKLQFLLKLSQKDVESAVWLFWRLRSVLPMHFYYFIQPFTSLSLRRQIADLQCS